MFYVKLVRTNDRAGYRRGDGSSRHNAEVAMFEDKTRILLVIPQGLLDQARVFAGEATSKLKRPVSLQIVLRALIDEGLKRDGDRAVFANVEAQVQAVRRIRSRVGRVGVEKTGPPRPAK